ncbi:MAG: DUF1194 domain-containing protein [Alphaproteobacteria bacterium]|nr:DUF1194 domain-containing protein [Alphaproteobacteria bacterium]
MKALTVICALALSCFVHAQAWAQERVDLLLVLAVDSSYSVDDAEYALQIEALGAAFRHPEVIDAIASGPIGAIAVAVVQWSGARNQETVVPWTLVTPRSAPGLGAVISAIPRSSADGATAMAAAIRHSTALFDQAPFSALRWTIDISADGRNNVGQEVARARDAAILQGATVNGLAILLEDRTLDVYFKRYVIGGPGAFVITAKNYTDFRRAIVRKLVREIRLTPVS